MHCIVPSPNAASRSITEFQGIVPISVFNSINRLPRCMQSFDAEKMMRMKKKIESPFRVGEFEVVFFW